MQIKNTVKSWGVVSQFFHWLIALLIFLAIAFGLIADDMPTSPAKVKLFVLHKSIGITVLVLVILRLLWKLGNTLPSAATGISEKHQKLAGLGHWALYGLMFAVPLSGWVLNTAANFPFKWMYLLAVPGLPGVAESWKEVAGYAHQILFCLLAVAVIGHGSMAVLHHTQHRSDVLQRMLPPIKAPTFAMLLFGVFVALTIVAYTSITGTRTSAVSQTISMGSTPKQTSEQPLKEIREVEGSEGRTEKSWSMIAEGSTLAFVGAYDDVAFDGEFKDFTADLYFDPDVPEQGYFNVLVNTGSITTYNEDWDDSLGDETWFFTSAFPQAVYQARDFSKTEAGFRAQGFLTLKGISKPVALDFTWKPDKEGIVYFSGSAVVNRIDFNIGSGEWAEDETIGFHVDIKANLKLDPR